MESTEEDFIRSLSHCVNWQARGGKSGAVFYATEGKSCFERVKMLRYAALKREIIDQEKQCPLGLYLYRCESQTSNVN